MNLKVDGSPAAVMHRGFFNPNSTITAKFEKEVPKEYSNVRVSFNSNFSELLPLQEQNLMEITFLLVKVVLLKC